MTDDATVEVRYSVHRGIESSDVYGRRFTRGYLCILVTTDRDEAVRYGRGFDHSVQSHTVTTQGGRVVACEVKTIVPKPWR